MGGANLPDATQKEDALQPNAIDSIAFRTLERTPRLLRLLLAGMDDAVLHSPNPEGWSIKDIVAHLHDAEGIAFTVRIRRMLEEDEPFIESIDPPARLIRQGYSSRALDALLVEFAERRAANIAWLRRLTPSDLARIGHHDTGGVVTPKAIIHQWAFHDLAHLRQVAESLQATLTPSMGNTRTFYPEAEALYRTLLQSKPRLGTGQ